MSASRTIGWLLHPDDRDALVERFPPHWPDGSTYHITWSLDRARGREPKQSNDVLRERGWERIGAPIPIRLTPAELG